MIRVGFYLGSASISSGGIAPYAWRVLDLLLEHSHRHGISLKVLCDKKLLLDVNSKISEKNANASAVCVPNWVLYQPPFIRFLQAFGKLVFALTSSKQFAALIDIRYFWYKLLGLDLLHVPYQVAPIYHLPCPVIITMHDVQELHLPQFFTPEERAWRAKVHLQALKSSDAIIVSYPHIKQDLIKYFRLSDEKVNVCRLPYASIKFRKPSSVESTKFSKKYGDLSRSILFPAQTWEHKNHISLVKALESIKDSGQRDVTLLCTGKKNEFYDIGIEPYLKSSSVASSVFFLGVVSEQELSWLYCNCSLVVIPTLYEAGSFPLLEAMFHKAPVICSNVTSLPYEIADQSLVFDPLDIDMMTSLIIKHLDFPEIAERNRLNSCKRSLEMKALEPSGDYVAVYRNVLRHHGFHSIDSFN
jgi:glycosyltransferase involved in cell wall biosynthesis